MNTREYAIDIINMMNEKQLEQFINLALETFDRAEIAKIESKIFRNSKNPKLYSSFSEFLAETEDSDE